MQSIVLYEVRVIEKNKISRQFTKNLSQLFSLVKDVGNKKVHVYRIYKSLEGDILSSEKLDCEIQGNNFIIKSVRSKPITNNKKRNVRKSTVIDSFKIIGKETSNPKILSHLSRKIHFINGATHSRIKTKANFKNPRSKISRSTLIPRRSASRANRPNKTYRRR